MKKTTLFIALPHKLLTMSQLYRFCIPNWYGRDPQPNKLKEPNFVTNQVPYLREPFGSKWNLLFNTLIDGSFNFSMIQGDLQREGICMNSLHDNTSDIQVYPADLPIDDETINIYAVIGESKMEFMSSYNFIDLTKDTDVLDSLTSFNCSLWMLIFLLLILFAFLIKSKKSRTCPQYLRDISDRLHRVFTHFIGQNSMDENGIKVLVITLTFFSLMINQYYNALIHTDLVVPITPEVPHSYEDLANIVTVIRFPKESSALKYFKESPDNYPERRLLNKASQRNVYTGDDIPELIARKEEPWFFFYETLYALTKTHVSISTGLYMTTLNSMTCSAKVYSDEPDLQEDMLDLRTEFAPQFKNLYPWVASDPDARPVLHAFIKRKDFTPDNKIWKRVKSSIEHGVYQRLIWNAETLDMSEDFIIPINKRASAIRDCQKYSRTLKIKEVGFQDLKTVNFEKFTLVFIALVSVCCMAYIIEVIMKERHTLVHPI